MATGDFATVDRAVAIPSDFFRAIGTDPEEWWGSTGFLPILRAQWEEMGGMEYDILEMEAWETDTVGWGAMRIMPRSGPEADDTEPPREIRITTTLVLDAGTWRIVQWHASHGIPNEETLGFALTTTLSEILDEIDFDQDFAAVPRQGMLTLMFTDVADSTGHARTLGDQRFVELMRGHIALVTDLAQRADGQVIKAVGDGTLVVFPSARAAVACAVAIQRHTEEQGVPFAVRIGLHAGDVVRTDSDVMGFAVNKAARVTSAADGGQIVASSVVRELVGYDASYTFGDSLFAELKGIDGIHELIPVHWVPVGSDRAARG